MAGKARSCCAPAGGFGSFSVESVISVDERGQMVLPKEVRDRAGIRAGDKLAVISMENGGKVCCIALMRAGELAGMVREVLGPMMKEIKG